MVEGVGGGGASLLLAPIRKNQSTADTCLSSAYTSVVAPRGLHFHACWHISLSLRLLREIRYFEFVVQFAHSRKSGFQNPGNFCCGIRKTAQGLRNPTKDRNPESKFHCPNPVSLKSGIQDFLGFLYMGRFSGTTTK